MSVVKEHCSKQRDRRIKRMIKDSARAIPDQDIDVIWNTFFRARHMRSCDIDTGDMASVAHGGRRGQKAWACSTTNVKNTLTGLKVGVVQ